MSLLEEGVFIVLYVVVMIFKMLFMTFLYCIESCPWNSKLGDDAEEMEEEEVAEAVTSLARRSSETSHGSIPFM